ncbi:hypothetical protein [Pseudotabrizicola sp. L79]|uniref:hypothetical protein n=1 Tax=Pseudotabrizicola sp. L79 TaxID=3118402 RepID=UPI002F920A54
MQRKAYGLGAANFCEIFSTDLQLQTICVSRLPQESARLAGKMRNNLRTPLLLRHSLR